MTYHPGTDTAVANTHGPKTCNVIAMPMTKTVHVDINRIDDYVENGDVTRPFKTVAAAIAAATGKFLINFAPGTYPGNLVFPVGVSVAGCGTGNTIFSGNITIPAGGPVHIYGVLWQGTLEIHAPCSLIDCFGMGQLLVKGTATIQCYNTHVTPASGIIPLKMESSGKFHSILASLISTGDVPAIDQNNGMLVLDKLQISANRAAGPALLSTAGVVNVMNCYVLNYGGGASMDIQNGATTTPNSIADVMVAGNVVCGTAVTSLGVLKFLSGALTGSKLSTGGLTANRPASPTLYQSYFDTGLGTPRTIWWTGAAWVDATGTGV